MDGALGNVYLFRLTKIAYIKLNCSVILKNVSWEFFVKCPFVGVKLNYFSSKTVFVIMKVIRVKTENPLNKLFCGILAGSLNPSDLLSLCLIIQ